MASSTPAEVMPVPSALAVPRLIYSLAFVLLTPAFLALDFVSLMPFLNFLGVNRGREGILLPLRGHQNLKWEGWGVPEREWLEAPQV
jgi:hypothetical protein